MGHDSWRHKITSYRQVTDTLTKTMTSISGGHDCLVNFISVYQ